MGIFALIAVHAIAQTSQGTIAGAITDPFRRRGLRALPVIACKILGSDNRTVMTGPNG